MRLFIAFDIPESVKEQLVSIQKKIKTDAKISWVKAENMHLTIKFLGEVAEDKVEETKKKLSSVKFKPFEVSVSEIGVFPSEDYIRVIWVGLKDDKSMQKLAQDIREALPGFKDDYPFKAHLTIARVKFVKDKKALVDELKKLKPKPEKFSVENFKLYKSTLTREGPVYEEFGVFS
jgi:2'-5' RNA ligase